jgi:hypothetical protein
LLRAVRRVPRLEGRVGISKCYNGMLAIIEFERRVFISSDYGPKICVLTNTITGRNDPKSTSGMSRLAHLMLN